MLSPEYYIVLNMEHKEWKLIFKMILLIPFEIRSDIRRSNSWFNNFNTMYAIYRFCVGLKKTRLWNSLLFFLIISPSHLEREYIRDHWPLVWVLVRMNLVLLDWCNDYKWNHGWLSLWSKYEYSDAEFLTANLISILNGLNFLVKVFHFFYFKKRAELLPLKKDITSSIN